MLSLLSGFLASLASVLGKMGMASDRAASICQAIVLDLLVTTNIEAFYVCESVSSCRCDGLVRKYIRLAPGEDIVIYT